MKFIGTNIKQDFSFKNNNIVDNKSFNYKINIENINLKLIYKWINYKIKDILNFEDEILENLIINHLEDNEIEFNELHKTIFPFFNEKSNIFLNEFKIELEKKENKNKKNIKKLNLDKFELNQKYESLKEKKKYLKNKLIKIRKIMKKSKKYKSSRSYSFI